MPKQILLFILLGGVLMACQKQNCYPKEPLVPESVTERSIPPTHTWETAQKVYSLKPFGHVSSDPVCTNAVIHSLAFSPDSQILAISMGGSGDRHCGGFTPTNLTLWDLKTGQLLHTLHQGSVDEGPMATDSAQEQDATAPVGAVTHHVAFSPDGGTLAGAMSDTTIKLWDVKSGTLIRTLKGHKYGVHTLVMAPDNQTLISGSADQTIRVWNWRSGQMQCTLKSSANVYALTLNASGQYLVSITAPTYYEYHFSTFYDQHQAQLWDLYTAQKLQTWPAYPMRFTPDGQQLLGIIDNQLMMWSVPSGANLKTLDLGNSRFRTLAISPDGTFVASHSGTILPNNQYQGLTRLWNLQTDQIVKTAPLPGDRFSPDGTLLTAYDDQSVVLWHWEKEKQVRAFDIHFAPSWGRNVAAFSPDGQTLVTVDYGLPGVNVWR